ncbi:MAG: tyrosine-type recombinase/integrase [Vicinamibacterales bacterium]
MAAAPGRLSLDRFLTTWLEDVARPRLRPRTFLSYSQVIRAHIVPHLGRVPLRKLSPQHVQRWLNDRSADGLSPRTCQYARAILRSALAQAVKWGMVARNAAALVDPPRAVQHRIRPLSPSDAKALLAVAASHRLGPIVTVALSLGLRQGEVLGLKWEALDFDAGLLSVRAALQWLPDGWRLVEPKSERSRRVIALPDVASKALQRHRVRQLEERMLAGQRWREHGLVFTTRTGTPIEPSNLTKTFRALLTKAGVPRVRFHDLRHTAATFLLVQGVDPRTIMETLGHSQISLTMNTYSHVLPPLQRNAAKRMDDILTGTSS